MSKPTVNWATCCVLAIVWALLGEFGAAAAFSAASFVILSLPKTTPPQPEGQGAEGQGA